MGDTISREEATNYELPQLHERLKKLMGKDVMVIAVVVDDEGLSVLGNSTHEGLIHYLRAALDHVTTSTPDKTWEPPPTQEH